MERYGAAQGALAARSRLTDAAVFAVLRGAADPFC
jgi:hypothetical protein